MTTVEVTRNFKVVGLTKDEAAAFVEEISPTGIKTVSNRVTVAATTMRRMPDWENIVVERLANSMIDQGYYPVFWWIDATRPMTVACLGHEKG